MELREVALRHGRGVNVMTMGDVTATVRVPQGAGENYGLFALWTALSAAVRGDGVHLICDLDGVGHEGLESCLVLVQSLEQESWFRYTVEMAEDDAIKLISTRGLWIKPFDFGAEEDWPDNVDVIVDSLNREIVRRHLVTEDEIRGLWDEYNAGSLGFPQPVWEEESEVE